MSKLGERVRSWAFGRRLTDPGCFPDYEAFKYELTLAFKPPKNEFRARAEFLDLPQGRLELHDYAQRVRYLVPSIVNDPVDYVTQVVTFMKDLNDGLVKTQLFREYPETMEDAINRALQEEFSLRQARIHQSSARQPPPVPVAPVLQRTRINGSGRCVHTSQREYAVKNQCQVFSM